jgi:hypothetical protein
MRLGRAVLVGCLLVAAIAPTAAAPPQPGTTDSGLTASEEATLWSNASAAYWDDVSTNDTVVQQLAANTDLTFDEPPDTAARWTQYAHGQFEPGGVDESVHPKGGFTYDSRYIKDAHATIFALTPSTWTYVAPDDQRLYVAPEGTLRGAVDYRVDVPDDSGRRSWSLLRHDVDSVRLSVDDERVSTTDGTHRPSFEYALDGGRRTVTLEARIEATIMETVRPPPDSNRSVRWRTSDRWVEVSNTYTVDVYDFDVSARHATYPDGREGMSITQSDPWQGYSLDSADGHEIRSGWRFFTARPSAWHTLVASTESGTTERDSHAVPVAVHAYPSSTTPRTTRVRPDPTRLRTWGPTHDSPASRLPENVAVDVVEESYTEPSGIAVRDDSIDPGAVTVHGIVRGTETTLGSVDDSVSIGESELTTSVIERTDSAIEVRLDLEDAETGEPIVLADRSGYIEIADERLSTNASGQATIRLTEPGVYTATYHADSWLDTSTPYAGDTATVRWHPLTTLSGWIGLALRFGWVVVPLAVAWYAGRQVGSMFQVGGAP